MSSTIGVSIGITAHSSYVSDPRLDEHLREMAEDIKRYTEMLYDEYRKVQIDYEEQESVDLSIIVKVEEGG